MPRRKKKYLLATTKRRFLAGSVALMMLASAVITMPIYEWLTANQYELKSAELAVVGEANKKLADKLVFNKAQQLYQFNADAKAPEGDDPNAVALQLQQRQNVTGDTSDKNLYSLDLPTDATKGMAIYDNNSNLSVKLIPQFEKKQGRKVQDRLVYPIKDTGAKAVYTVKNNGLKEDIVYLEAPDHGEASYSYTLELPDSLEAKLADDGSLGIYSADPNLFGDISYGSDEDQEKIESARRNAPKDHLVFAIPAPVIVAESGNTGESQAWFKLDGNTLTIRAKNLDTIDGAFSIDPSVVVTSSSDFRTGTNEGGIEFGTDEISRGSLMGGELGTWNTTTSFTTGRDMHESVEYNGYVYILGGYSGSTPLNDVQYAPINSDGTLGSWQTTSSFTLARSGFSVIAHNDYMYVIGGYAGTNGVQNDVQYAPINSDGTLGSWQTTSSFTTARQAHSSIVSNGYVYLIGGASSPTTNHNDVQYAPINADGTLGTWQTTSSFTTARLDHTSILFNGYVYIIGGAASGSLSDVQYAKINTNGTLSAWQNTTSLIQPRQNHSTVVYGGYVYVIGGYGTAGSNSNISYYAPIYANGSVGTWNAASKTFTTARFNQTSIVLNDYVYIIGGYNDVTRLSDVQYSKIEQAGMNTSWSTTTSIPTTRSRGQDYGSYGNTVAVHNGYIYTIGGYGVSTLNTVHYAAINSNGTVGTWTATTSLPAVRQYHSTVVHNGYIYAIGGVDTSAHNNTIYYAAINTNGTLGTWQSDTSNPFTNARSSFGAIVHNNKLYLFGGYGTGFVEFNDVQYASFNTNGSLGAFTTTTSFNTARDSHYTALIGNYVYIIAGWNGTTHYNDVQYAELDPNGGLVGGLSSCPAGGTLTNATWCTTTSLSTARSGFMGYTNKGCVYAVFGTISGGQITNTSEFTCANPDGTLNAWTAMTSPSLVQRDYAGATVHNDTMYMIGGEAGGPAFADVQYSRINNGGPGTTGTWSTTTSITTGRAGHASVAYDGHLYILGGSSGSYLNDVQYAPINTDGTVGSWTTTTSFTTGRSGHTSLAHNGYIYLIGGKSGLSSYLNDVQYAPINTDGTVGSWTTTTSFTTARDGHTSVVNNNNLYVIGGYGSGYRNDVQYAPINTDGTVGSWTTTTSFTTGRNAFSSVVNNNFIYVIGGYNEVRLNDVQYAPINTDGTVGSWTTTTSFTTGREGHTAVVNNGFVYLFGGTAGGSTHLNDVQYAPINSNGTIGSWTSTTSFTTGRYAHSSAVHRGYVFVIGGQRGVGDYGNETQSALLNSIPRIAAYSKVVDLGSSYNISGISYTGSLGEGNIRFRYAGVDGVFSGTNSISTLGGTCETSVVGQYVLISVVLDDAYNAVFLDSAGTKSSLQDITVDYISGGGEVAGVDPAKRLRGGKYYDAAGILQGLDTAKAIGTGGGAGGCI